ncbi:MAG TPA: thioesterase family protein [Gemmatimonadaceae bacterium]
MHKTHRTEIQMRFCDTDALGHINNAKYAEYVEHARLDFLRHVGTTVQSLILANLNIDYRKQVGPDETIYVESWIERLGNSSISVRHAMFANGERAADVSSVVVHFDYAAGKAQALTDEMRRSLGAYVAS